MNEIWLTKEDYEKRKAHLEWLKTTKRVEIAEALKIARGFGDLSENAEYDAAKNEMAKNTYDIGVLEEELEHVKILDDSMLVAGGVSIGSTVTFLNTKTGKESTYTLVGTMDSDPINGKISNESPIGGALMGHKTGDTVEVHTPNGIITLKIITIGH